MVRQVEAAHVAIIGDDPADFYVVGGPIRIESPSYVERRADAEYALELFKERQDLSEEEKAEFVERCERMQVVISVRAEEEKAAERLWRQALNRAERETTHKERRLR